jgi:hypothetical protein
MNSNLELALRYAKHRDLGDSRPYTELAALSCLDEKTIRRCINEITSYYVTATRCTPAEAGLLDDRLIKHILSNTELNSFRDLLGALCGYLLAYRGEDLSSIKRSSQVSLIGKHYFDILLRILSHKDQDKGAAIHSKSTALRYLRRHGQLFNKHFNVNDEYYAGSHSKRYMLTSKSKAVLKKLGVLLKNNLIQYVRLLGEHMEGVGSIHNDYSLRMVPLTLPNQYPITKPITYTPPYICSSGRRTFVRHKDCIALSVDELANLSLPSLLQVMGIASLSTDQRSVIVPLKNLSSTDPNLGRIYNIFTRLRGVERKALGYNNYDMSGGIQIISFGLLYKYAGHLYQTHDDLFQEYPMIFSYGYDQKYKDTMRESLAAELNISIPEVKALLTAYANGSNKNAGDNEQLAQFREESDKLRREVISVIATHRPEVRELAVNQSRHDFPEQIDWEDTAKNDKSARKMASVYFFIWTYFEKQIRDVMLSLVDDGIPVHDAIYSKRVIPFQHFEDAIFKQTGFEVKISK